MTSRVSPRGTAAHRPKPTGRPFALVAPGLLLLGLSLWNNARKSAWTDEAFSFATAARHPLSETVSRALHFELQPPLYFSLLNLWLRADPTIEFGRLLSTVCALGALVMLWATGRRLEMRHPSLVAWIAALTTGLVWASTELRGYALVLLLVATANFFFVTLVITDGQQPRRPAAAYAGAAIACLFTFYYTGFVLAGHWLAAMVAGRRRALVTGALAAAALVVAPLAPTILMQIAAHPNPHLGPAGGRHFDVYGAITTLLQSVLGETPLFQVPHIRPIALAALGAAPIAWLVSRRARGLARRRTAGLGERPSVSPAVVLAIVVSVPMLILGMLRATGAVLVYPRHTLVALPGLLLWLAYLIHSVPRRSGQFAVGTAVVALLLVALVDYEIDGVQVADWRSAAHYVAAHAAPSEPVFVAPSGEAVVFQYYYRPTAVVAVPTPMPLDVTTDAGKMVRDSAQLATLFDSAAGSRSFWMVISDRPTVGDYGRPVLEHYLQQRYRVLSDTATFNVGVRHLVQR